MHHVRQLKINILKCNKVIKYRVKKFQAFVQVILNLSSYYFKIKQDAVIFELKKCKVKRKHPN